MSVGEIFIKLTAFGNAASEVGRLTKKVNELTKAAAPAREAGAHLLALGAGIAGAGAIVGYGLKRAVDAAAEINAAMTHLDTNLDSGSAGLREHAEALALARKASVQFNYAQKDIIDNLYRSISFTGDFNEALAVTKASLALAKGNRGDAAAVGEQFAIIANDFVDKTKPVAAQIQHLADLTSFTVRHGAFTDINQLTESLKISIGSAKAAGLSYEDLLATVQGFSKIGLAGTEAGSAIEESLAAFSKGKLQKELGASLAVTKTGGLDIIGTFVNLRKAVGAGTISVEMFKRSSAALGIRGERALGIDVNDLVAFRKQLGDPNLINGDAMRGAMTMMGAFNEQIGALGKRWDILLEHIGTPLIGPIQKFGAYLGAALDRMNAFAEAHPAIVKAITLFTALAATTAIVVGGVIALAGAALYIASFGAVIGGIIGGIAGVGLAVSAAVAAIVTWSGSFGRLWDSIKSGVAALGSWLSTNWKLILLAALTGPFGLAIVAIQKLFPQFYDSGVALLKNLASGILSAIAYPVHAIEGVVKKIRDFLPFSPAKTGPLATLNRVRIIETVAERIQPGPVTSAMRRVAAACRSSGYCVADHAYAGIQRGRDQP